MISCRHTGFNLFDLNVSFSLEASSLLVSAGVLIGITYSANKSIQKSYNNYIDELTNFEDTIVNGYLDMVKSIIVGGGIGFVTGLFTPLLIPAFILKSTYKNIRRYFYFQ